MSIVLQNGVGSEASYLQEKKSEFLKQLRTINSLNRGYCLDSDLASVWEECRLPNWDGYNALPIQPSTFAYAKQFLEALPPGLSSPSIGAEPDGDITFEWRHSPRMALSVSINRKGGLHYAALLGSKRKSGTDFFVDEIPRDILNIISLI